MATRFLVVLLVGAAACSEPQDLKILDDLADGGAGDAGDAGDAAADSCADAGSIGDMCTAGQGACEREGTYVCTDGKLACNAEPGMPSDELCDTQRDEDCDGKVDEAPQGGCCHHEDCGELELCKRPADDALAPGTCMSFERPNADCKRDGDTVSCTCNKGYEDDNGTCVRNACIALPGEDPPCAPNQTCEPGDPGKKTCACEPGFDDCDADATNGCEQALNVAEHCGACDVACDPHASCAAGTTPRCMCDRPLIGDGSSCMGFGPISAGFEITCGIRQTGAIECFPASAPTPPSGTFKQLAVGINHHCGLKSDSSITCWGSSSSGAMNVPADPPNSDYVQVVVGNEHTCALKNDGTPVCWGVSQTNPGSSTDHGQSLAPDDKFQQLAAGNYHTCGLHADGTVRCWGAGTMQGGTCDSTSYECGQAIAPDGAFIQITAGLYHTCGLRADGSVLCWGAGATDEHTQTSPHWGQLIVPTDAKFRFISAGSYHTCGVTTDGKVACWGAGQSDTARQLPADFGQSYPPSGDFLRVASGFVHTCGLTTALQVRCWGGIDPNSLPDTSTTGTWPVNP